MFDSVEEDEYVETINKLGANVRCIDAAEGTFPQRRAEDGKALIEGLTNKIPSQNTIIISSRNSDSHCYNRACNAGSDARLQRHEFDNDSFNPPVKSYSRERREGGRAGVCNLSGCFPLLAYQQEDKQEPLTADDACSVTAESFAATAAAVPSHSLATIFPACHCSL